MKILVVSDTHGNTELLYDVVSRNRQGCDLVIHLGDCLRDLHEAMLDFPTIASLGVRGNCDYASMYSDSKTEGIFSVENKKIFYTHGMLYNVNETSGFLAAYAKSKGANIALYGHTHVGKIEEVYGVTVINPGSLSLPRDGSNGSYALLYIVGDKIDCKIVEVEK